MSPLLSVRDLHVGFGHDPKANEVVKGVSFDLAAGETLAIAAKRLKKSSSGPNTTDGRVTIAAGMKSRTAASPRALVRA